MLLFGSFPLFGLRLLDHESVGAKLVSISVCLCSLLSVSLAGTFLLLFLFVFVGEIMLGNAASLRRGNNTTFWAGSSDHCGVLGGKVWERPKHACSGRASESACMRLYVHYGVHRGKIRNVLANVTSLFVLQ